MFLQPFVKEDLGGGYLIGDSDAAVCAIVGPPPDMIEDILQLVANKGLRVISVIECHEQANTCCRCRELAQRTGATLYVHELTDTDYPHQKLPDGIYRFFWASGAPMPSASRHAAVPPSPDEQRERVCRYLEEVMHRGNGEAVDETIATNCVLTWPGRSVSISGSEAFKQLLILYTGAFPDLEWTTEEVVVHGDTVVARLQVRGTHLRELMGVPPTGKQMIWTETHIFRMEGSKLVEHWTNLDAIGTLQQLGVLPKTW